MKTKKELRTAAVPAAVIRTEDVWGANLGCCRYIDMLRPEAILLEIF
jgi:hypothetical protein